MFDQVPSNASVSHPPRTPWRAHVLPLSALQTALLISLAVGWTGYRGYLDDDFYLIGAGRWLADTWTLGVTHWELRHPYVLALAGAFRTLEFSELAATLPGIVAAGLVTVVLYALLTHLYSRQTAVVSVLLFVTLPLVAQTSTALSPDMLEFLFVMSALSVLVICRNTTPHRERLSGVAAGVLLGLAWMTRETTVAMVLCLAAFWVFPRFLPRRPTAIALLIFSCIAAGEAGTYWLITGHPTYRVAIDRNQYHPASRPAGYLSGFEEVDPATAMTRKTQVPIGNRTSYPGPFDFGKLNPVAYFFVNHEYGLIGYGALLAAVFWFAAGRRAARLTPTETGLIVIGLGHFVLFNYVLEMRPLPRYHILVSFLFCLACARALLQLHQRGFHKLAITAFLTLLFSNAVGVDLLGANARADMLAPRVIASYARTGRTQVQASPELRRTAKFHIATSGRARTDSDTPQEEDSIFIRYGPGGTPQNTRKSMPAPPPGYDLHDVIEPRQTILGRMLGVTRLIDVIPPQLREKIDRPGRKVYVFRSQ